MSGLHVTTKRRIPGRALLVDGEGALYISRGYEVLKSTDEGENWRLDCRITPQGWRPVAARFSLGARLLRFNIQAFQRMSDGARVAVARDGIYRAEPGEVEMRRTWQITRGSRPINLGTDGERVLFGEYGGGEMDRVSVRVYCSFDGGRQFEVFHEFPRGDIHHLHNIIYDPYSEHYWVLAGDHGRAPGVAALSRDGRHLEWLARGSQLVRAVNVLIGRDCLIYGTDSEVAANYIVRLDKNSGRIDKLRPTDGSSLYAMQSGKCAFVSTAVEPSKVNGTRSCMLYGSVDGEDWSEICSVSKDLWPADIFQFGTIVLPYVHGGEHAAGMWSGQALRGYHNQVSIFGWRYAAQSMAASPRQQV